MSKKQGRRDDRGTSSHRANTAAAPVSDIALRASWFLVLAAVVIGPLVMANVSFTDAPHAAVFFSATALFKALTIEMLVGLALACFGVALVRGVVTVRWHRVAWIGAGFVAWSLLTVATAVSPATSLIGFTSNADGWIALATFATAGFLVLQLATTQSRVRELLTASALTATAVAVYGLIQTLNLDPVKGQYTWGLFRSFATMGNPDTFGAYMALNLFVIVGLLLSESDKRLRAAYAVAAVLVGAATFTSLTRAAWLGALVGAVVLAVLLVRVKVRITRTHVVVAALVLALIATAGGLSLLKADRDSNVAKRITSAFNSNDKNTLGRTETWRIAIASIKQRPITGWGPDAFALAVGVNRTEAFSRLVTPDITQANAHSSPLQLATESGLPAVIIWFAFIGTVLVIAVRFVLADDDARGPTRVLVAGVVASIIAFWVASLLSPSISASSLLLWCFVATLLAPTAVTADEPRGAVLRVAGGAVALVGVAAFLSAALFVSADMQAAVADNAAAPAAVRLQAAGEATRLNPLSAEYPAVAAKAYAQALMQEAAGAAPDANSIRAHFDAARIAMNRSVAMEQDNPHRHSTLVGLLIIGGTYVDKRYNAEAVTASRQALRLSPNDLESAYWYARALNADGQGQQAVPVLERVLAWRPDYVDAAVLLSDLYVKAGKTANARQLLERSIRATGTSDVLQARLDRLSASPETSATP